MFRLTAEEVGALRFEFGMSKREGRGGRRYWPYVFTEQGVAMLSSVLRSKRAIQVNIAIMRAFVRLRQFLATHKELAEKLTDLERKIGTHDEQIEAIRALRNKVAAVTSTFRELPKRGSVDRVCLPLNLWPELSR